MRRANGTNYAPESTADGLVLQRECWWGGGRKKTVAEGCLWVQRQQQKKKMLETGGRRASLGFSFLIAVCWLPRRVEVSGWIAATQEFMSVIFRGAIQARPGPIKRSQ